MERCIGTSKCLRCTNVCVVCIVPQVPPSDSDLKRCDRWSLVGDCRRTVETSTSCGVQANTHQTDAYITFNISRFTRFTFHISRFTRFTHTYTEQSLLGARRRHSRCSGNAACVCLSVALKPAQRSILHTMETPERCVSRRLSALFKSQLCSFDALSENTSRNMSQNIHGKRLRLLSVVLHLRWQRSDAAGGGCCWIVQEDTTYVAFPTFGFNRCA
eukprot:COSAG06_NODE_11118_length_1564_cov_4.544799_2_plen_216_part_00